MKRYWLIAIGLAVLPAACGDGDDTSALQTQVAALQTQTAPAHVVGVELKCIYAFGEKVEEHRGMPDCRGGDPLADDYIPKHRWQEVTVRTATGAKYTVNVSAFTSLAVGDEWPPK